jgi:hypothetical protein
MEVSNFRKHRFGSIQFELHAYSIVQSSAVDYASAKHFQVVYQCPMDAAPFRNILNYYPLPLFPMQMSLAKSFCICWNRRYR